MKQELAAIALVVEDYDAAISFYCEKLKFSLLEDTRLSESKRWVRIKPPGASGCCLLLAKASGEVQASRIGNQTGGRVFLFMHTNDIYRDYLHLLERKIQIIREPTKESWGTVLVFSDLYGNLWDLIQPV